MSKMESKLTVIYGTQWGSEGKGNFASKISEDEATRKIFAVRNGSINSGHTTLDVDKNPIVTQLLPSSSFSHPFKTQSVLASSCYVHFLTLFDEISKLDACHKQLPFYDVLIDSNAGILKNDHQQTERDKNLKQRIGSTQEGVGAATSDRVMRTAPSAKTYFHDTFKEKHRSKYRYLKKHIRFVNVAQFLNERKSKDAHVIVEGTQGVLLSLYTSGYYPYCTSRQCDPYSIMGSIGITERGWDSVEIIGATRTHPIRVGGNSGELPNEVTWKYMKEKTDGYIESPETTSVTNRFRRIAEMDLDFMNSRSFKLYTPDSIALSFLDYVNPEDASVKNWNNLSKKSLDYIEKIERKTEISVNYVSTNPGYYNVIKKQN